MLSLPTQFRNVFRFAKLGGRFRPYFAPHARSLAVAVGLTALYAGIRVLEPWPLQILLDQVVLGQDSQLPGDIDPLRWAGSPEKLLGFAALAILILALLSGTLYYVQSVLVAKIGQLAIREIREDVYHQMLRHSLAYHRKNEPGDLLMRLTGDMMFLREMLLAVLVTMTGELILLVTTLGLMFWVSPKLTWITLVTAPALILIFRFFRTRMREAARKQRKREGRIARQIGEALIAIPMIQSFTAESREDERFRKICKRSERIGVRSAKLEAGMQRLVEILIALGTCLVVWFGIREILAGNLTPGVFLVFLAYVRALFKPVRKLGKVAERTARASAAAARILEVIETPRDVRDSRKASPAPPLTGAIEFRDVHLQYENGQDALKGVSFSLEPGEQVALTGKSGAGKSSILGLLLGFHRPTSGRLKFDGIKVKHLTLESLRRQIAYLPQEPFLVAGTLRENLLYGDPEASDEKLYQALDRAELGDFVRSLPHGLDTYVASRGQSLSGGQKQRVAIARAMLKDAPILLLDEPTVGLDRETADQVLASLDRLRQGRTTILIAHQNRTTELADRIIRLDEGQVVEDFRRHEGSRSFVGTSSAPRSERSRKVIGLTEDDSLEGIRRLNALGGTETFVRDLGEQIELSGDILIEVRKHRPGQRALLQVDHDAGRVYVKLFRSKSTRHLELATSTSEIARTAGISAPAVLGWLPRFRALVFREATEPPWWNLSPEGRRATVQTLGRSLQRLHALPTPGIWGAVEDEASRLDRISDRVRSGSPHGLANQSQWTQAKGQLLSSRPSEPPHGPIHGDIHPEQLRGTETGVAGLLDWDLSGIGSPARDSGNFVAHLELEELRGRLSPEETSALATSFLGKDLDDELLRAIDWHRRVTLLRLAALYDNPAFGSRPELNRDDLGERLLQRSMQSDGLAAENI